MEESYSSITVRIKKQKREDWEDDMDDMGVPNYSEFIRMMVAAGRHQFLNTSPFEGSDRLSIRQEIEDELTVESYTSWDEIMDVLFESYAQEAERVLNDMEEADKVEHSPRNGGWKLYER